MLGSTTGLGMKIHFMRLARHNKPPSTRKISRLQRQLYVVDKDSLASFQRYTDAWRRGVSAMRHGQLLQRRVSTTQSPSPEFRRQTSHLLLATAQERCVSPHCAPLKELRETTTSRWPPLAPDRRRQLTDKTLFKVPFVSSSDDAGCRHSDNHFVAASTRKTVRATTTFMC